MNTSSATRDAHTSPSLKLRLHGWAINMPTTWRFHRGAEASPLRPLTIPPGARSMLHDYSAEDLPARDLDESTPVSWLGRNGQWRFFEGLGTIEMAAREFDDADWPVITAPSDWHGQGYPKYNAWFTVWFRRRFSVNELQLRRRRPGSFGLHSALWPRPTSPTSTESASAASAAFSSQVLAQRLWTFDPMPARSWHPHSASEQTTWSPCRPGPPAARWTAARISPRWPVRYSVAASLAASSIQSLRETQAWARLTLARRLARSRQATQLAVSHGTAGAFPPSQ